MKGKPIVVVVMETSPWSLQFEENVDGIIYGLVSWIRLLWIFFQALNIAALSNSGGYGNRWTTAGTFPRT